MFRYAITIFLSAFLLFQVQPLIGKFILPWFGGTPAVWTTCMLFFQAALLAGYSYAHFLTSKVSSRGQIATHLVLLAASLIFLPIAPSDAWKPQGDELPIGRILALLSASIGLPYFMLSTTGPLLQELFRRETGKPPYRLYALSNVGSLLALLSYPFVFEPTLRLETQIIGWSVAYTVFAAFCGWCALGFLKPAHHPDFVDTTAGAPVAAAYTPPPTAREIVLWVALAACGSAVLLSTTNLLCQEICSVPFLWILPLALYLTTFIICFDHERWYNRNVFLVLLAISMVLAVKGLEIGTHLELWKQIAVFGGTMWVCCMVCHGELTKSKPAPRYATLFYLTVSAGGVLGGILVAAVAPLVLTYYWEYQISLVATIILAFAATSRGQTESSNKPQGKMLIGATLLLAIAGLTSWFFWSNMSTVVETETLLERNRNFYGVLRVIHYHDPEDSRGPTKGLIHGRIKHGYQYDDPEKQQQATSYFGHQTGVGLTLDHHPSRATGQPLRIGIVGLGCGTLAVYGREGDLIRFYEINPDVIRFAQDHFTYCKDSKAKVEFILGDARIKMEQEVNEGDLQKFDVLVIDAFSSDAIPMHLLTLECAQLFKELLKPDGVLCMHITNRFLNLVPVVRGIAESLGMECVMVESDYNEALGLNRAKWMVLTNNKDFLKTPELVEAVTPWSEDDQQPVTWTDDYGSLWKALLVD